MRVAARMLAFAFLLGLAAFACFLPFAGRYLVAEDPLAKADAIVVLAGARVDRWLEAVDLYHEGWAPRIVLSPGRVEAGEVELRGRGVRFPSEADLARDAILQLDVPAAAVITMPGSIDNTADEARVVREMLPAHGWRRLIVVTAKYHTRRAQFAFDRALGGTGVEVIVRGTRHDRIRPERWWTARSEVRWVTSELQKLAAYRLGLAD